jgi:sulfatase maturation enzyme AslB (radical SAM superfamily)
MLLPFRKFRLKQEASLSFSRSPAVLATALSALKDTEKRPRPCQRCQSPFYCAKCGQHATHRPDRQTSIFRGIRMSSSKPRLRSRLWQ